jgi:methionyl-tRNA formyltransferase
MFDTVILVAGAIEHALLSSVLQAHNAQLQIYPVFTTADLAAIEQDWLERARLVAFATPIVIPPAVIDRLGFGAYRFHAGSPDYPDMQASQFALQDGARQFGATAHRVTGRDAAGPIVDLELFSIPTGIERSQLDDLTRGPLLQMFWRLAGPLARQPAPLVQRAVRWGAKRTADSDISPTTECFPLRRCAFTGRTQTVPGHRGSSTLRVIVSDGQAVEA